MPDLRDRAATFFSELKRRHVIRVAVAYLVVAAGTGQAASMAIDAFELPSWTLTFMVLLLGLGFPIAVVLAWAFDITPGGVRRTDDRSGADHARPGGNSPSSTMLAPPLKHAPPRSVQRPHASVAPPPPPPAGGETVQRLEPAAPSAPPAPERVERASLAQLRDELRAPALAIVAYSRMLLDDPQPERAGARDDLTRILVAGELFESRLESLLDPDHPAWEAAADREAEISRVRHDLRTPLNAIIGYSELVLEEHPEAAADAAFAGDVRRINAAARQLLGLLEEVVLFSGTGRLPGADLARASSIAQEVLSKIRPLGGAGAGEVPFRQGSLLVVDDQESNRDLLSRQLAHQGYTVASAANGREALAMLAEQDFDLLLLDILMPEMDGIEVLRRVRADASLADLTVIVISALDEVDSVIRCIEMGAADFVSKPFDPVLLGARIGAVLEVRRLRQRERAYADALRREQAWVDRLLTRTFPASIAERVRAGEEGIVETSAEATVVVAGLHGTAGMMRGGIGSVAQRLGDLWDRFDALADTHGVETVKTTGACYMAVVGLPGGRDDHARAAASLGLAMQEEGGRFAAEVNEPIRLRIGVHTGAAAVGMVSKRRLSFDVWGDAVETAQQLQFHAAPGSIQVSPATYAHLRESHSFVSRGVVDIPGRGQMRTYLLQGFLETAQR